MTEAKIAANSFYSTDHHPRAASFGLHIEMENHECQSHSLLWKNALGKNNYLAQKKIEAPIDKKSSSFYKPFYKKRYQEYKYDGMKQFQDADHKIFHRKKMATYMGTLLGTK